MKKALFTLILTFLGLMQLQAQNKNSIIGTWVTENKDGKIQIFEKNGKYFGKTIWGTAIYEKDGKTLSKDIHNPNKKLRNRTLKDMVVIENLQYDKGEWKKGTIYDPTSGKTYKCKIKYKNKKIYLRGYVGTPILGKTTVWTKVD